MNKENQYNMGCPCCMARYAKEVAELDRRQKRITEGREQAAKMGQPGATPDHVFATAQKCLDAGREILRNRLTS